MEAPVVVNGRVDSRQVKVAGLESIRVQLPGERRSNGEVITETAEYSCRKCLYPLYEDGRGGWVTLTGDPECVKGDAHEWVPVPLAWANSVNVEFDEEDDAIRLQVSVTDPRGALSMTVRRYVEDGVEKMVLSVPHENDSFPHARLTPIGDGSFLIG
jgi:hypothetical protein